jgi:BirA family transcriptional regulator, biotin operon repressor / biotin---[acetyl-CoA-carboxylase] ligase
MTDFESKSIDIPIGWRHQHLRETISTNSDCLNFAQKGDLGNLWISAMEQTSGRGRMGRTWVSQGGNLFASVLLRDAAPIARLGTLPFVGSLALYLTFSQLPLHFGDRLKIKWPNDILIDGAKVSGLLIESIMCNDESMAVVCGFGVNIAHHPEVTLYPTTSLLKVGISHTPLDFLEKLIRNFADMIEIWNYGKGFAKIREEWLRHAKGIGETIKVSLPNERFEGIFVDIDSQGCLILQNKKGDEHIISAGDVFFPVSSLNNKPAF